MGSSVWVVTGSSRGLGLELVTQLLERGNTVVATVRNPGNAPLLKPLTEKHGSQLIIVQLDVAGGRKAAQAAAAAIAEKVPAVDVLINNAGIGGGLVLTREESEKDMMEVYRTNAVGPLMVTQALLPLLQKGTKKQIVNISSGMGSIQNAKKRLSEQPVPFLASHGLSYKGAKAALNMQTVALAADLKDGFTVISMCPGWVATDMGNAGGAAMGGAKPPLDAPASVKGQLAVIDGLTQEQSGMYVNHAGETIPY